MYFDNLILANKQDMHSAIKFLEFIRRSSLIFFVEENGIIKELIKSKRFMRT